MIKIKYTDWVVGSRVGNTIYLNKYLKEDIKLHDVILKHELEHSDNWNITDLMLDIKSRGLKGVRLEYWKFIFKHPKSLIQFLPLMKLEGKWCFDFNLIIFWAIMIIFIGALFSV